MEKLLTPFGEKLDREKPLTEYPRPQLVRDSYFNLNGIWEYAIYPIDGSFDGYQGEIVVPFSPECLLSGVNKVLQPNEKLFYRRKFNFFKSKDRVLLHFGAVDYKCEVFINGKSVGEHKGGYFPFTFDITNEITDGENIIEVTVTDPSEKGTQARGKQTSKRGGIWYTPQSGIWQTVWIEEVGSNYLVELKLTPDIDNNQLRVKAVFLEKVASFSVKVIDKGIIEKASVTIEGEEGVVSLENYQLWSPENPYLYDLEIEGGGDKVGSYFGMRKFGIGKDKRGISRLMLNNEPYFHNGLLDQGYWSDGMYTAPSDEALIYDIKIMKDMGFNMLRKHIKIEPLRWYYHCDRLGMLVWQDMINGGGEYKVSTIGGFPALGLAFTNKKLGRLRDNEPNYAKFSREDADGRAEYYKDAHRLIDTLYNTVSLAMWVPFNEGWGQFDSLRAYSLFKSLDSTRTIDHASGWHDQGCGDINSFHIYFTQFKFPKYNIYDERPIALTEFGGYSLKVDGHMFNTDKFFGYRKYYDKDKFTSAIENLYAKKIQPNLDKGLSAIVYTEVSDVEDECNGLLTYDRQVVKVDMKVMQDINKTLKY